MPSVQPDTLEQQRVSRRFYLDYIVACAFCYGVNNTTNNSNKNSNSKKKRRRRKENNYSYYVINNKFNVFLNKGPSILYHIFLLISLTLCQLT